MRDDLCRKYLENEMELLKKVTKNITSKFGGLYQFDNDDFYSLANMTLWQCSKDYDGDKNDNFDAFFVIVLKNKIKTEMTRRNRKRRIPAGKLVYGDEIKENGSIVFDIVTSVESVEEELFGEAHKEDKAEKYMQTLSRKQREIAELIIQGEKIDEIRKILNIEEEKFQRMLTKMSSFEKRIILK